MHKEGKDGNRPKKNETKKNLSNGFDWEIHTKKKKHPIAKVVPWNPKSNNHTQDLRNRKILYHLKSVREVHRLTRERNYGTLILVVAEPREKILANIPKWAMRKMDQVLRKMEAEMALLNSKYKTLLKKMPIFKIC